MKRILMIGAGAAALIIFFAYSVAQYRAVRGGEGFLTCAEGKCYWSAHMHVLVRIHGCGARKSLPKFIGPLSGAHTHAEENIMHWHEKLLANPATGLPADETPLRLSTALDALGIALGSCPSGEAGAKYFVNGIFAPEGEAYRWHDRDIVDIIADERGQEDARAFVDTLPKDFPKLGEG